MSTQLHKQFETLEQSRKALFNNLRKYPDELLNKSPAPGKWSVVQVMGHLMTSEGASLKYLQKKTLDTSRSKHAGFGGKRRLLALKFFFYAPVNFNAPTVLLPDDGFRSLSEVETEWTTLRNDLNELIGKLSEEELQKELWLHPMAGKMNIYQMLEFFGIHFERHRRQIERTAASVSAAA